jgi:tetratricopeptide (TPR) repeat protein
MQTTESLNQQALRCYGAEDIPAAASLWQQSLQLAPNQTDIHVYLGAALKQLGDDSAAIASYERALELSRQLPVVYYNLGNIHQQRGNLEKAAACYQNALAQQPDMALAAYNLGNVCRDQGHLKQAMECYQHAINRDPGHAPSYNNLGNAYKHEGELGKAIPCYEKALQCQPDYADAQYNLGNVFYEQQDFAAAIPWFDKAAIRDAEARSLYCSYKIGQFEDFRLRLEQHRRHGPHHSPQVATLVAHHAVNFSSPNNYQFCPQPFDFVYHEPVAELAGSDSALRDQLLDAIANTAIDERTQGRLHKGVQSSGNLFHRGEPVFRQVAGLVRQHFEIYRARHGAADCELIRAFPQQLEFESSWYIRMQQGGHLTSHIHETGWISGALYLALPEREPGSDEGCFEVSLHGDDYPIVDGCGEFTSQVVPIEVGDIVLFPANLFHRTIPFQAAAERICIAFDLKPSEQHQ